MAFRDIDRSKPARAKRWQEYLFLASIPYPTKEEYGRLVWLRKQKVFDLKQAWKEEEQRVIK